MREAGVDRNILTYNNMIVAIPKPRATRSSGFPRS
jgi:hypothetical protein